MRPERLLLFGTLALVLAAAGAMGAAQLLPRPAQTNPALVSASLLQRPIHLSQSTEIRPTGRIRTYELTARRATWEILPGVHTEAVTYNGTVPGPEIRVTEGDTLRVTLKNELDQETSIHWHGLHVPNAMDGVPGLTQAAVRPGATFTYEFVVSHAGTFMYHPHINSVTQIDRGLYGLLIVDPQTPDPTRFDREFTMMLGAWQLGHATPPMSEMSMGYNYFTINGKAFPATEPWTVREGDLVRVRIANISNLAHPMHLHGHDFKAIAKDGEPLPAAQQWVGNTLSVNAGETYDIVFVANNPGAWMFHCHELHHTENAGVEPGGLIQIVRYEASGQPNPPPAATGSPMSPGRMPGMGH